MCIRDRLMDARFGHFAEKLEKDGDRVSTVYARNAETGKYVKATASKGVILATGEYSSNPEFLKFFCPATVENEIQVWWPDMDVEGKPVNQGDGLKLGNWVGAAVQQHHAPMIHWMGGTYGGTGMDMSPVGTAPFLYLNKMCIRDRSAGASAAADDATVNGDYPWPVNPPEIAAEDVEEEVSADIIIVGLGIAGVAAARSAVEEGASIIAFEKSEKPNVRSGDFAIMGGETMKRWGRENIVDIDEACDHEVEEGSYFPKRSIYTKWAKHSGEAFDWYLEAVPDIYYAESSIAEIPDGVEQYITPYFVPLPDGYDFTKEAFPCYPSSVSCYPDQKFIFEANWDMVVGTGLMDARFGHFAEKLEKDGDRVSTVYALSLIHI